MNATSEITCTRQQAGAAMDVLRRLGWHDTKLEYRAGARWTDENIDHDRNRLAVYHILVRVKWNPNAGNQPWWEVPPVLIMSILADTSLAAVDKVGRIFNACNGTDWAAYSQDIIEANTNTFLAGLLAG